MFRFFVLAVVLNFTVASEDKGKVLSEENDNKHNGVTITHTNNVASHHNITYIDKAENMLRTPNVNKLFEDHHKKLKKPKKTPKRTVQKIIKKKQAKMRKFYVSRKMIQTTATPKVDYEKMYQEDTQWKEETTTQANLKKKSRKYSPKAAGYRLPFQKRQPVKDKKLRHKREGLSRELYILKDLDEIEFLSKERGDQAVVRAHVKDFW